jgi:hypothetical protein
VVPACYISQYIKFHIFQAYGLHSMYWLIHLGKGLTSHCPCS